MCVVLMCMHESFAQNKRMDELWDGKAGINTIDNNRGKLFREGKYAMFIHWGLFSQLENKWKGKNLLWHW